MMLFIALFSANMTGTTGSTRHGYLIHFAATALLRGPESDVHVGVGELLCPYLIRRVCVCPVCLLPSARQ